MAALCACAMPRVERVLQAHCQQHFNAAGMFYDFLGPHPSTSPRPGVFSVLWMFHIISIMAEQIKDSWDVHASILSPAVFTFLFVNDIQYPVIYRVKYVVTNGQFISSFDVFATALIHYSSLCSTSHKNPLNIIYWNALRWSFQWERRKIQRVWK